MLELELAAGGGGGGSGGGGGGLGSLRGLGAVGHRPSLIDLASDMRVALKEHMAALQVPDDSHGVS